MLIDTDVFIWYFRGNKKAADVIQQTQNIFMSSVVYMELLQGMRNKQELINFKKFVRHRHIVCLPLTPEITSRAVQYLENFALSHGLRMPDALIAATSDISGETLLTGNDMHYKMISSLTLKKFRP